jgi:hypothetical protein
MKKILAKFHKKIQSNSVFLRYTNYIHREMGRRKMRKDYVTSKQRICVPLRYRLHCLLQLWLKMEGACT